MASTTALRDVMSTDLLTANPDDTVADAARLMQQGDVGPILVVNESGKLTGLITDRDIVVRVVAMGLDPQETRLGDVASSDLHALAPEDTVDDAVRIMRDESVRRIPVCRDGDVVGIVSIGDLALRKDKSSALADISKAQPNA